MRMKNIILTSLTSEQFQLQEQIERLLNSSSNNVSEDIEGIKEHLRSLVLIESMIEKWNVIVPPTNVGGKNKENG